MSDNTTLPAGPTTITDSTTTITDNTTNATTQGPNIIDSSTPETPGGLIAGTVCGSVTLVIVILTVCLCFRRYRRKRARPRMPLPSLDVCNTRHSVHHDTKRPDDREEERSFDHGGWGGNAQSGHEDGELYENTSPQKKTSNYPNAPAPCVTHSYYNIKDSGPKKPAVKPKPRLILGPSKNRDGVAKNSKPSVLMTPETPCYIDILPERASDEFGQNYSYVPTHWPPGGKESRAAPPKRQTSDCSMNYYNMPPESSYQNVETKLQS